jgi:RNA polymerase sigma-70 factor (ECF subfamily)
MNELQQLVRDCQKGKILAQRQLYELFAREMMGVCYRYTKSIEDAEDVLQEGFMKVFANLGQFEGKGPLGAWIRRIMVNTSINYLKKHVHYRMDMVFTEPAMHPVTQETPDVWLDSKELCALIRQLPTGYQAVFNLHAVEGYSHVEIGQMLGISENTSRSQYMRARNLLCSWIQHQEEQLKNETYGRKRL